MKEFFVVVSNGPGTCGDEKPDPGYATGTRENHYDICQVCKEKSQ